MAKFWLDCRQFFNGLLDECDSFTECIGVEREAHPRRLEQFRQWHGTAERQRLPVSLNRLRLILARIAEQLHCAQLCQSVLDVVERHLINVQLAMPAG